MAKEVHVGVVKDVGLVRGQGRITGLAEQTTTTYPELHEVNPDALLAMVFILAVLLLATVGLRVRRGT